MSTILRRRAAARAWNDLAAVAAPGEIWTMRYAAPRSACGGQYVAWTAGPVTKFSDDHPVVERRGARNLGEMNLDRPMTPGWFTGHSATRYRLTLGDTAPTVRRGDARTLLDLPGVSTVTVEYDTGTVREVVTGRIGEVEDFHDGEGPGIYVGDSWVCLADVTGVQT